MQVDLHCHSHFSDGKHQASFLVKRALINHVTHLALTDHDCIDVHTQQIDHMGLSIIKGVEISSAWQNSEIHIVGLCINVQDPGLKGLLEVQQEKRRQRVHEIDKNLSKSGIIGLQEYMSNLSAVTQTRSHIADFLVQKQYCSNRKKVFKQYLNKNGKAYVKPEWSSIEETIRTISKAGGIAVLAHPSRYAMNRTNLTRLITDFKKAGGSAIECTYPNISTDMQTLLLQAVMDNGLLISGGSDFHDASATWTDVGKFPSFPKASHELGVWRHSNWSESIET